MGERILIPYDGTPRAKQAMEYALDHFPDGEFVALTVVDLGDLNYEYDVDQGEYPVQWLRDAESQAEEVVAEAVEIAGDRADAVETAVRFGVPSREIVACAEESDADGVVLGSHGREDVSWTALGSVAGNVVRKSPVPVTVVR
jgi:nucleotide-binding universal stress UspA family protein